MRKQALLATVLGVGALAFTGAAYAIDNNVDGVAQYHQLKVKYNEQMSKTHYKQIPSDDEIGNPAHQKLGGNAMGDPMDIEPAAGERFVHEDGSRYNQ